MSTVLPQPFNARNIPPASVGVSQLPVSDPKLGHLVVITDSEVKPTKAGDGGLLELTCTIIDGEHKGASGTYRLNLWNPSEKARNIANAQMSALCHVTGVFDVQDSRQLHDKPFRVIVALQKGNEENKNNEAGYTEIKGVKDANGNDPGKTNAGGMQQAQPQQQPQPQQPNNGGWQQNNTAQPQQQPQPQQNNGGWQTGGGAQQPPAGTGPRPPWNQG